MTAFVLYLESVLYLGSFVKFMLNKNINDSNDVNMFNMRIQ